MDLECYPALARQIALDGGHLLDEGAELERDRARRDAAREGEELGREVGQTVSLNKDDDGTQFTITSIQAAPPDRTPATNLPDESAVEAAVAD